MRPVKRTSIVFEREDYTTEEEGEISDGYDDVEEEYQVTDQEIDEKEERDAHDTKV